MKQCPNCSESKELIEFASDKKTKDGLYYCCKKCKKELDVKYRFNNRAKLIEQKRTYYRENKEILAIKKKVYNKNNPRTEYKRKWKSNNKKRLSDQAKQRYDSEPLYRLTVGLRNRIQKVFKGLNKSKTSKELLGVNDIQFIFNYMESKFQLGMSWGNYGKWHVDHVIPLCTAKTEKELENLCHYTNLQPLWAKDNLKKSKTLFKRD